MKIHNKTNWRTRHIRAIAQKVAEEELDPQHRKHLVIEFIEAKRGSSRSHGNGSALGWARYGTNENPHPKITIVMPKSSTVQRTRERFVAEGRPWEIRRERVPAGGNADPVQLAHTIAHELAHTRGMTHAQMRGTRCYSYAPGWRDFYAWAAAMPLELKAAAAPPSSNDLIQKRSHHAASMLRKAETRLKRASTIVKKWRAKTRYYERRLAAQRPGPLEDQSPETTSE